MENQTVGSVSNVTNFRMSSDELYDMFLIKNYYIICLYVPVIILALTANTLVILVVVKYNFMRR